MQQVKDYMVKDVETIHPKLSLRVAALRMKSENVDFLPVIGDSGELVGVVTYRDIVEKGVAMGDVDVLSVEDVMTTAVYYCFENQSIRTVSKMLGYIGVQRIPVLSSANRVMGILSITDLLMSSLNIEEKGEILMDVYRRGA